MRNRSFETTLPGSLPHIVEAPPPSRHTAAQTRRRIWAACAAVVSLYAGANAQLLAGVFKEGPTVQALPGCEGYEPTVDDPLQATATTAGVGAVASGASHAKAAAPVVQAPELRAAIERAEKPFAGERSSATFGVGLDNIGSKLRRLWEFYQTPVTQDFTMASSGIRVVVHAPFATVNPAKFENAFAYPMYYADEFSEHPLMRSNLQCLRERVLHNKEFAGHTLSLYMLRPGEMMANGGIVPFDIEKPASTGFTPPDINTFPFFGNGQKKHHLMIVGAGPIESTDGRSWDDYSSDVFRHELMHLLFNVLPDSTGAPWRLDDSAGLFGLEPNEREAAMGEADYARFIIRHSLSVLPFMYDKTIKPADGYDQPTA